MSSAVMVSNNDYKNMMKQCKKKGYTFTYDKSGKRTLVRLVDGKMYEFVKGKKDRQIMNSSEVQQMGELVPGNDFGKVVNFMVKVLKCSLDEAMITAPQMMNDMQPYLKQGFGWYTSFALACGVSLDDIDKACGIKK